MTWKKEKSKHIKQKLGLTAIAGVKMSSIKNGQIHCIYFIISYPTLTSGKGKIF